MAQAIRAILLASAMAIGDILPCDQIQIALNSNWKAQLSTMKPLWTMATPKISILSCREQQDAQDIPHQGGHHDQFEAPRAHALAGNRRR